MESHDRNATASAAGLGFARADDVVCLPPQDQQQIAVKLGRASSPAVPSKPSTRLRLLPAEDQGRAYPVTRAQIAKRRNRSCREDQTPGRKSGWRFQLSPSMAGFIHQTPERDLVMPAVTDTSEGVVVVATPANPFVLKGMKPGDTRSYSQQVSVIELDDPADQEYSGSLNGTYAYVGTYQVTVPAGTYEAILLRLKCEGKVGPAHTHDAAYYFFAPGTGVVAMISQEDATAFWIIHIDTSSGKVLMSR